MVRKLLISLLILGAVAIMASCQKESTVSSVDPQTNQPEKPTGPVLATVNEEAITVTDFKKMLDSLPKQARQRVKSKEGKLRKLEEMIRDTLFLQEAKKRGLDTDEGILLKVERYKKSLITESVYKAVASERTKISDADIKKYYAENREKYTQKEKVRARQIVILVPPDASSEKEAEARARAEEVLSYARKGDDFVSLVKKYSEGPTKSRDGDLGYFTNDKILPSYGKVAFALKKPGSISDIVRSGFGFHIVQLMEKKSAKVLDLKTVRDRIVQKMESKQKMEVRQSLARNLRDKAQVEIYEELLE